ncbi:MAG TPA: amino acid permease [Candidatus Methylacidiphilales bacterium]
MDLLRTKSLDDLKKQGERVGGLRRVLTAPQLVGLSVGTDIGTGVFVLTGHVAAEHAGPALVLSLVVAGLASLFAGLCYAEYASMIPVAGSAYTYAYATCGELLAWIIGWDLILEYLFGASTVAVGWSGYCVRFLHTCGIEVPARLASSPWIYKHGEWIHSGALFNLPAVLITAFATWVIYTGIRESARLNLVIVVIKVSVILLFVFFGAPHVNPANWHPFIPPVSGDAGQETFGFGGVLAGAGVIFFAYLGFEAVSTAAQESRNPQRDMPIGILGGLLICTVLYLSVAVVLTGLLSYKDPGMAGPAPVAYAIEKVGPSLRWLYPLIQVGALAGLTSVIFGLLLGQSRLFYSMSEDGLLPAAFTKIHAKRGTPWVTTLVVGAVTAVISALFPIGILGELTSIGTLLAFLIVCASVMVLRYTQPDAPRSFRTPWVPLVPILGLFFCGLSMYYLPNDTWIRLVVWMAVGFVVYFSWSRKNSRLEKKAEAAN